MSSYIINKCNSDRAANIISLVYIYVDSFPALIANAILMPLMRELGLQFLTISIDIWERKWKKNFEVSPKTKEEKKKGNIIFYFIYFNLLKAYVETSMTPHWLVNEIETPSPSNLGLTFNSSYYFQPHLHSTLQLLGVPPSNPVLISLLPPPTDTPFPAQNPTCSLSPGLAAIPALPHHPHQGCSPPLYLKPRRLKLLSIF